MLPYSNQQREEQAVYPGYWKLKMYIRWDSQSPGKIHSQQRVFIVPFYTLCHMKVWKTSSDINKSESGAKFRIKITFFYPFLETPKFLNSDVIFDTSSRVWDPDFKRIMSRRGSNSVSLLWCFHESCKKSAVNKKTFWVTI